jgi:hypothetical protein
MSRIILQPCGNRDAREHYVDTIENRVDLNQLQPFLTPQDFNLLLNIYPSGSCLIWGVTPGGNNITKWNRIERGDVTLFSRDGRIFASAVTTFKLQNLALAASLWNYNNDGETWEYIYFLEELNNLNIPYINFNTSVGYADNYIIQGFNVLNEEQSSRIFQDFDLQSDAFIQDVDVNTFDYLITQLDNLKDKY